jgi:cell division protein FtsW
VSAATAALRSRFGGRARAKERKAQPIEHSLMLTVTMCLVAFGAVMIFSASSTASLLGASGDGAYYLKRTVMFGVIGLVVLRLLSVWGLASIRKLTPVLLAASLGLLLLTLVPGIGSSVNGARSWIVAGPVQVQPAEIVKVTLLMYGAHLITARPKLTADLRSMRPYLLVVGAALGLIVLQPDIGTALVVAASVALLLVAAGTKLRHLALLGGGIAVAALFAALLEPYRMARLTSFLDPGADAAGSGFQVAQSTIALGSGGIFGVGLGESVQKAFYLPEAHTDMISAVIGEEIGLLGIALLVGLYGLFAFAGYRIAQRARDTYGALLAAGLTSMILIQATVNLFAAMGMAPLTGVTLPFVSYGNSSLIVTLAAVGLLLNIAGGGRAGLAGDGRAPAASRQRAGSRSGSRSRSRSRLRLVEGAGSSPSRRRPAARRSSGSVSARGARSDRGRRDSRARGAGTRRRRRA